MRQVQLFLVKPENMEYVLSQCSTWLDPNGHNVSFQALSEKWRKNKASLSVLGPRRWLYSLPSKQAAWVGFCCCEAGFEQNTAQIRLWYHPISARFKEKRVFSLRHITHGFRVFPGKQIRSKANIEAPSDCYLNKKATFWLIPGS